ncbi:MAG: hypothetical protein A2297_02275 [Elusimicrobia bacterium RIFOXYB2_FULL_48_7]|nr:MAG: hypothetical protein A2297_02275 [Elusimicrobia bacterium RIFOXYB2_FULL_48_7]
MTFQFKRPDFNSSESLSRQVAGIISAKIQSREIPVGEKLPGQEDLRKAFNVSIDTMFEALSSLVKEGYIARRRNYGTFVISSKPGAAAGIQKKNELCLVHCLGALNTTSGGPNLDTLLGAVEKSAREKGFRIIFKTFYENDEELFLNSDGKNIAGLIISGHPHLTHIKKIRKLKMPFVLIRDIISEKTLAVNTDVVTTDDFDSFYAGTKHLLKLGHREILFFATFLRKYPWNARALEGYRQALKEAGIPVKEKLLLEAGRFAQETAYTAMKKFLDKNARALPFTAVISINNADNYYAAARAFNEKRINIPEDISVVVTGDNIRGVTCVYPEIAGFGATAVERIFGKLANPLREPERIVLPQVLAERESTKPLKGRKS